MTSFRVAACQMNAQGDKGANLAQANQLIDEAARLGATMIALPEMFNLLGEAEDLKAGAEPIPGQTSTFLSQKAREHQVTIHGGSFLAKGEQEGKVTNTTLIFDPDGNVISRYNKIHLFDINLDGQIPFMESDMVESGTNMVNFETDQGNFGLSICYDLRFPELYRALTLNGAQLIFLCAAFTLYTGKDHWETLIRARAIENQVYMVCPSQIGSYGNGRQCYGSSMIVDPWGTILARAPERVGVIIADIDYDAQEKVRNELPALHHRREDIYSKN